MKLLRFKDNTYSWIHENTSPILSEAEAIAYGIWKLKVKRDEIQLGLINLKAMAHSNKDNVAIYGNTNKMYLYSAKIGKDIDTTLDENGGNIA
jgi:hypothetical protein